VIEHLQNYKEVKYSEPNYLRSIQWDLGYE
jgi:hypothetical protein